MQFADRLNNVETSAIRELFKLLGKPGIISFAGGFPDSAMFDVEGIRAASNAALTEEPGAALQYGATEGYNPLREQLAAFMTAKGANEVAADNLIVTTGSQQALDLLGKTLISPGDKVIVEGPTFLATIQCFRLYGAELISAPIDGNGVKTDELEKLIAEHQPKFVYLIPTFGNPSGAMLSLERRKAVLEMAVKHNTLIVEDDPAQMEGLRALLASDEVETVGAGTAAQAFDICQSQTVDCIVLDMTLPDASGFDLLERLDGDGTAGFPPVIVYTARALSEAEEQRQKIIALPKASMQSRIN